MEGSINIAPNKSEVMDMKEACGFLKISEAKLRRLVNDKRVPYFRIDGRILFSHLSLGTWIQSLIVQPDGKSAEDSARDAAATIWKEARGG
jgi:Helix-turn-helix domain